MIFIQATIPVPRSFWDFNVGNLLTWIVVAVAWIWSKAQDWYGSKQRIISLEKDRVSPERVQQLETWKEAHELEAKERDNLLRQLEIANTKLTALAEFAERRLQLLEERTPQWDGRDRRNRIDLTR